MSNLRVFVESTVNGRRLPPRLQQWGGSFWEDVPTVFAQALSGVMMGTMPIEEYYATEAAAAVSAQFSNRGVNSTGQGG